MTVAFSEFSRKCDKTSEVCKYWNGIAEMNLVSADGESNWDNHMQAVKDLLSIFTEADGINYLHYALWYFENIRKLHISHADVYENAKVTTCLLLRQIQETSVL